jgi:hypothetical protein
MIWSAAQMLSPLIAQVGNQNETWSWVVNILTAVVGTLLMFQLREIKQTLAIILEKVQNHAERIAVLENQIDRIEEDSNE